MKGHVAYRGFQEPRNCRLPEGVEPLGTTTLLTLVDEAEDGPEPAVAAPLPVFFVTSSEAIFFIAASLVAFFLTATSSEVFFFTTTSSAAFFLAASSAAFFLTAASSAAFFFTVAASMVAFFFFATSLAPFFAVAACTASFTTAALVDVAMSPAAELSLDPRAPLPMPLLMKQTSACGRLEGPAGYSSALAACPHPPLQWDIAIIIK
jgi:hypothetical protein